jgi:NAD-specific glutamate dehydrogenase
MIDDTFAGVFRRWEEQLLADADSRTCDHLVEFAAELPSGYKQDIEPERARIDLDILAGLAADGIDVRLEPVRDSARGTHRTGLHWREVTVLRGYAEYLRQAGFPYSSAYVADALCRYPASAAGLVECFTARFDPTVAESDGGDAAAERVSALIEGAVGLDEDRIFRALLGIVRNTLRTNDFAATERAAPAIKLDRRGIGELSEPRPRHEIFVYSPNVAGVHMRFGAVARGGLRWSDRREDFRADLAALSVASRQLRRLAG